jgi:hypothetical protein
VENGSLTKSWPVPQRFRRHAERKPVRVVVPINQTFFFIDKVRLRGLTAEIANEFEIWLNKNLKTKRPDKINVFMIPTGPDNFDNRYSIQGIAGISISI